MTPAYSRTVRQLRLGGCHCDLDAVGNEFFHKLHGCLIDFRPLLLENFLEKFVFVVADSANGLLIRRIGGVSVWKVVSAGLQEAFYSLITGFAVDKFDVIVFAVKWNVLFALAFGHCLQKGVEGLFPGQGMHAGCVGDDAVKVKYDAFAINCGHVRSPLSAA